MSKIQEKFEALLESGLNLGARIGDEVIISDGGIKQIYEFGNIYFHTRIGAAFECHGLILQTYIELGEQSSGLGYPVSDESNDPSIFSSRMNRFEAGTLTFDPLVGVIPTFDELTIVPQIVVKVVDDLHLGIDRDMTFNLEQFFTAAGLLPGNALTSAIHALLPELTLRRLFDDLSSSEIRDMVLEAQKNHPDYIAPVFDNFLVVDCPDGFDREALVAAFELESSIIEYAYVPAPASNPTVVATGNPFFVGQGYLGPSPQGIGVQSAWAKGADGSETRCVDLEQGWFLGHEDLPPRVPLLAGINRRSSFAHGTAVLGILAGVDNDQGIVGIAPKSFAAAISYFEPAVHRGRTRIFEIVASRILASAISLSFGDVLQLEAQFDAEIDGQKTLLPVETNPAVFRAIELVTRCGIIVIEAAGNGNANLDNFRDRDGRRILARNHPLEFKDSGAILVGGCTSDVQHGKVPKSNFGSRIDCCAWGENIITTGNPDHSTQRNAYWTGPFFGNTSGATPIITGVCLLIQNLQRLLQPQTGPSGKLGPFSMRDILRKAQNGTVVTGDIGSMPDMAKIIANEYINS